jgi:hypothetical protein
VCARVANAIAAALPAGDATPQLLAFKDKVAELVPGRLAALCPDELATVELRKAAFVSASQADLILRRPLAAPAPPPNLKMTSRPSPTLNVMPVASAFRELRAQPLPLGPGMPP